LNPHALILAVDTGLAGQATHAHATLVTHLRRIAQREFAHLVLRFQAKLPQQTLRMHQRNAPMLESVTAQRVFAIVILALRGSHAPELIVRPIVTGMVTVRDFTT